MFKDKKKEARYTELLAVAAKKAGIEFDGNSFKVTEYDREAVRTIDAFRAEAKRQLKREGF